MLPGKLSRYAAVATLLLKHRPDLITATDPVTGDSITKTEQSEAERLGMVGHLSPTLQDKLLKLILAIAEGRGEEAAESAIALGEKREDFDEGAFTRDVVATVGHYYGASLQDFQVGRIVCWR